MTEAMGEGEARDCEELILHISNLGMVFLRRCG